MEGLKPGQRQPRGEVTLPLNPTPHEGPTVGGPLQL